MRRSRVAVQLACIVLGSVGCIRPYVFIYSILVAITSEGELYTLSSQAGSVQRLPHWYEFQTKNIGVVGWC
jgi:hypothetical protein